MMKWIKYHVVTLCLILMVSCSRTNEEKSRLIESLIGSEVYFPNDSIECLLGSDIVKIGYDDVDFWIVSYVDSVGCSTCKMKFDKWSNLLSRYHGNSDADILFTFIVEPNGDIAKLKEMIQLHGFNYPVWIDSSRAYSRMNEVPSAFELQTFLLDNNRKIQAVGNPVYNPAVRRLYDAILFNDSLPNRTELHPDEESRIEVESDYYMLGGIRNGECKSVQVVLHNAGDEVAVVDDIVTSCDCTEASLDVDSLAPGTRRFLMVSVRNDSVAGRFERTVDVFFKNCKYPVHLTFNAYGI